MVVVSLVASAFSLSALVAYFLAFAQQLPFIRRAGAGSDPYRDYRIRRILCKRGAGRSVAYSYAVALAAVFCPSHLDLVVDGFLVRAAFSRLAALFRCQGAAVQFSYRLLQLAPDLVRSPPLVRGNPDSALFLPCRQWLAFPDNLRGILSPGCSDDLFLSALSDLSRFFPLSRPCLRTCVSLLHCRC